MSWWSSRAGEPDDEDRPVAPRSGHHLAARVHGEPPAGVDQRVPHPQAALLGFSEVVGVHHPGDPGLEVDGDHPLVRVPGHAQIRRVDDHELRFEAGAGTVCVEVQPVLHAGDVGVGRFDVQPRADPFGGVVADVAVDHHHLLAADVGILEIGQARALPPAQGLVAVRLGVVGDHVGAGAAPSRDPGLHVQVAEVGQPGVRHSLGQLTELIRGRVPADALSLGYGCRVCYHS